MYAVVVVFFVSFRGILLRDSTVGTVCVSTCGRKVRVCRSSSAPPPAFEIFREQYSTVGTVCVRTFGKKARTRVAAVLLHQLSENSMNSAVGTNTGVRDPARTSPGSKREMGNNRNEGDKTSK